MWSILWSILSALHSHQYCFLSTPAQIILLIVDIYNNPQADHSWRNQYIDEVVNNTRSDELAKSCDSIISEEQVTVLEVLSWPVSIVESEFEVFSDQFQRLKVNFLSISNCCRNLFFRWNLLGGHTRWSTMTGGWGRGWILPSTFNLEPWILNLESWTLNLEPWVHLYCAGNVLGHMKNYSGSLLRITIITDLK